MNSFKVEKILIPIDFSETSFLAIEHAAHIAQSFKAELILLHVVEKHWEKFSIVVPEMRINAPDGIINAIEKRLEDIAKNIFLDYGVKSTCITANGTIFSEVISVSKEQQVDLIVMGTHGTSGFVEFFIGSNAYKVVTSSDCPVITVQTHATKVSFSNILLPIDNSIHSRQKVNPAIVMARHFSSKLHIVGLADFDDDKELHKFEIKLEQIEAYIHKCGLTCTRETVKGNNQATMTLDYATKAEPDLIIIMTDQEENISGRLMGTYAQQIVNHSKIPVMSIQPAFGNVPTWTDNG
jgi:nucleotide-binding universal stress UspA family protein